jgi:hypothetical protein
VPGIVSETLRFKANCLTYAVSLLLPRLLRVNLRCSCRDCSCCVRRPRGRNKLGLFPLLGRI